VWLCACAWKTLPPNSLLYETNSSRLDSTQFVVRKGLMWFHVCVFVFERVYANSTSFSVLLHVLGIRLGLDRQILQGIHFVEADPNFGRGRQVLFLKGDLQGAL
jgi:hypothetical protein